jgi:hypothetical protein
MRSGSDTEPQPIEIDVVREGRARLLVHWDVQPVTITDEAGKPRTAYEYAERVIWWTLPRKFADIEEIRSYLDDVAPEIVDWAQATEVNVSGPPLNVALSPEEAAARAATAARSALNARYVPQFEALQNAYMAALILGDEATMATNRQEYQALLGQYNAELGGELS